MGEGVAQALDGHGADQPGGGQPDLGPDRGLVADLPDTVADRVSAAALDDLGDLLAASDVVFTSVATTHPIIDRAMLEPAVHGRRTGRAAVVVDLGVPRNVEPGRGRSRGTGPPRHG